jgi:hypothetical protein
MQSAHVMRVGSSTSCYGMQLALGLLLGVALNTATAGDFVYTVQPGDHPWNVAQRYLVSSSLGPQLLQLNKLVDDRHIMPGTRLRIPQSWLKLETAQVRVLAAYGDTTQQNKTNNLIAVSVGDVLSAPVTLRTGPTGSVTLGFADGSRVLMRRDSELQLRQTQQRVLGRANMTQLFLMHGSLENQVTPLGNSGGRFEIRTPAAVAAVRGTDFRVQALGLELRTEVLDGTVNVANRAGQVNTMAGQGALAQIGQSPVRSMRPLLQAPSLDGLPERIERLPIDLPMQRLEGAAAYRTQLAPDAGFNVVLSDETNSAARIRARDVDDGSYVLRLRAIDADGLEGYSAQRTVIVHARPASPLLIEPAAQAVIESARPRFKWAQGEPGWTYRLQIMPSTGTMPLDDQVVPAGESVQPLIDLGPAVYQWRVAAIQPGKGQGPWGDFQTFRRVLPGPGIEPPRVDDGTTTLRWPVQGQVANYRLQVARDQQFTSSLVDVQTELMQYKLQDLAPGTHYVRVQTVGGDGYTGPWGGTQSFVVPEPTPSAWRALLLLLPLVVLL